MCRKLMFNIKREFTVFMWVYISFFSIVATKSVFINPFTKVEGFSGFVIGIIALIVIFMLSVVFVYYVSNITWQQQRTKVNGLRILLYMLPALAVSFLLWFANWPAIVPYDTAYMWNCHSLGSYSNAHPITYNIYIEKLRSIWNSPALFVLIQIVFCTFVYGYVSYVFEKNGLKRKWCWAIAIFLGLVPVNAIYSVIMLKDVSYIMSLVFMSAVLFDYIASKKLSVKHLIALIVAGIIAWCSRYNALFAIPLTFIFGAFIYLLDKNHKQVVAFVIALILTIIGYSGVAKIAKHYAHGDYYDSSGTSAVYTIPSAQIAYITSFNYLDFTDKQKQNADYFTDRGFTHLQKNNNSEKWDFNFNFPGAMKEENINADRARFLKFYLSIIKDYPRDAILSYKKITGIVWAIPEYGYTLTRNFGIVDSFDHVPAIQISRLPNVQKFLDNSFLYSGKHLVFLWRPALYLLLILMILPIALKRHGKIALLVISPAIFNALGYMIANPSQNVRYLYCNLSIFIIFLFYTFMKNEKGTQHSKN